MAKICNYSFEVSKILSVLYDMLQLFAQKQKRGVRAPIFLSFLCFSKNMRYICRIDKSNRI